MTKKTIWAIVALTGGYVFCQALADVSATKIVQIGSIVLPAGSMVFALTFTLRDMIHKRLGRQWAIASIVLAGIFNLGMAAYLFWVGKLSSPVFLQEAGVQWNAVMAIIPAITLASITAEVISEWVDTEIYQFTIPRFKGVYQFMRVVISNGVSLPLDSLIFGTLAFVVLPPLFGAQSLPFQAAMSIVGGQIVFKAIVTVISMPGIYLVKETRIV